MVRELVEQTCRWKAVAVPVRLLGNFGRMSDERGTIAMEINNFKDMYLAELQELVSVESQSRTHCCGWQGPRRIRH